MLLEDCRVEKKIYSSISYTPANCANWHLKTNIMYYHIQLMCGKTTELVSISFETTFVELIRHTVIHLGKQYVNNTEIYMLG